MHVVQDPHIIYPRLRVTVILSDKIQIEVNMILIVQFDDIVEKTFNIGSVQVSEGFPLLNNVEGKKSTSKESLNLKRRIEQIQTRKNNAEDKWLDGELSKERYHELLSRLDKELAECTLRSSDLLKETQTNKPTLLDIAKLTSFEKLDRELLLMLVKKISIKKDGEVNIIYNFTV